MSTRIDEIGPSIYRISTWVEAASLAFNQFLIDAEEPLLFHTGMRSIHAEVSQAAARVVRLDRIRWIGYGHFEADECGAMNRWLAAAPSAMVVQGHVGVMLSANDQFDHLPRALNDGEVLDLGGKRVRWLATPHVPHGWDAGLLYEETTHTLFAGDLFTVTGDARIQTDADLVEAAFAAEDAAGPTALTAATAPTIRRLADLAPRVLAPMHAPAFTGGAFAALHALADGYEQRFLAAVTGVRTVSAA